MSLSFPDLGVTPASAEDLLNQAYDGHSPVAMSYDPLGMSGGGEHNPELADFVRQAMTLILHAGNSNTNPWNGPSNAFHIVLDGDNVLVWADQNNGPTAP